MSLQENLIRYENQPDTLTALAEDIPQQALAYRPFQEAWTIAEHMVHLADSEVSGFMRLKFAIAEPGKEVSVTDEEKWTRAIDANRQDVWKAMALFRSLRASALETLRQLEPENYETLFYQHAQSGVVKLSRWLEIYTAHVDEHIRYIERNLRLYSETLK